MRKLIFSALCILYLSNINAQRLHVDLFGGFSNYQGDIQEKKFTTEQSKGAVGIGLRYNITNKLALRSGFVYGAIAGMDSYNKKPDLNARNLSFATKITEGNFFIDYSLVSLRSYKFSPYFFGGIAVFHFNPYAYNETGNKVLLRPLSTEGQGLADYPNRKPYKLTQMAIPFGAGIRWRFSQKVIISYELGLRKTSTDYLDDLSTTYIDAAKLESAKGKQAVAMAFRGAEIKKGEPYPLDGTVRGGPKFKDWYYFSGITVSIAINGSNLLERFKTGEGRGSTSCPKQVL